MKIILTERQLKKIVSLLTEDTYPGANSYQIQKFLFVDGWLPFESDIDGDFKDRSAQAFVRYYYGINEDKKTDTLLKLFDRLSKEGYKEELGARTSTPFGPKMAKVLSDIIKKVGYKNAKDRDIDYKNWSSSVTRTRKGNPITLSSQDKKVLDKYGVGGLRTDVEAEKTLLNIFGGVEPGLFGGFYGPNADMTKFTQEVLSKFGCLGLSDNTQLAMALWIIWENRDRVKKSLGMANDETVLTIMRYAIGITERETKMGKYTTDRDDYAELMRGMGLGKIGELAGLDRQSLGVGQFTKTAWYKYGLDKIAGEYNYSFNWGKQILGIMYRLWQDYKLAISRGCGTMESVNPITKERVDAKRKKEGKTKMFSIDGSGNVSLDLAILAHNMGQEKIQKYCRTSDKNFAGPCNQKTYTPYKDKSNPNYVGTLTVYQDQWIRGYFPNFSHGDKTSIGYVEEVQKAYVNKTGCLPGALQYATKAPAMLEPEIQKSGEEQMYKILYDKLSPEQKKKYPSTLPKNRGFGYG
jgi:hypothetical protein